MDPTEHRKAAVELFNFTWTLMEKPDRTRDDDDTMLHAAHASRYHWGEAAGSVPANRARGEWQIARVYTLLGRAEPAMHHAQRCLMLSEEHGLKDWDIAFAHEAVARAAALAGDRATYEAHYASAKSLGAEIKEAGDREHFFEDLAGGPWFGMDEV